MFAKGRMGAVNWGTFRKELKNLRFRAGFNDADAWARHIQVATSTVYRAEAGKHLPRIDLLVKWTSACGVPLSAFLREIERTEPDAVTQSGLQEGASGDKSARPLIDPNPYPSRVADVDRLSVSTQLDTLHVLCDGLADLGQEVGLIGTKLLELSSRSRRRLADGSGPPLEGSNQEGSGRG